MELEGYWSSIRIKRISNRLIHTPALDSSPLSGINIEEAKDYYLELKGKAKPKLFHTVADRNTRYVIDALGNKDLSEYTSSDAGKFRDALLKKGLATSSVHRVFSSVKSIVSLSIKEKGIKIINPFLGVYIPDLNDIKERKPVPIEDIRRIQSECKQINDELRWMISIISDTGMRLAEVVGLRADDIVLDDEIPQIIVRPNEKRRLKTKQSERVVPLVGMSLWGATQALDNQPNGYLFQRYNKTSQSNANSASAALNKWMRTYVDKGVVIHSFRHSIRDRLRAVECPSDVVDSIGGWSKGSIGENYGAGYPASVLYKWLKRIE
jgi:integrase